MSKDVPCAHALEDRIVTAGPTSSNKGLIVDFWCKHCETSGSLGVEPEDIEWDVECIDCGCALVAASSEPRCDTCRDHHTQDCGEDCPIICTTCKEHHFPPWNEDCPEGART